MHGLFVCCERFPLICLCYIDSGKVSRAGLFSSTLSSRYDAHTTDSTWVCVFCKQGPHSVVPGDPARPHPNLAGPHIAPGTYTVIHQQRFTFFSHYSFDSPFFLGFFFFLITETLLSVELIGWNFFERFPLVF